MFVGNFFIPLANFFSSLVQYVFAQAKVRFTTAKEKRLFGIINLSCSKDFCCHFSPDWKPALKSCLMRLTFKLQLADKRQKTKAGAVAIVSVTIGSTSALS